MTDWNFFERNRDVCIFLVKHWIEIVSENIAYSVRRLIASYLSWTYISHPFRVLNHGSGGGPIETTAAIFAAGRRAAESRSKDCILL